MLKFKLLAILTVLGVVGTVFLSSTSFSSQAKDDVLQEIAGYKTWKKLVKPEPKIEAAKTEAAAIQPGTFQISDSSVAG
jgi:hypothetical protein